MEDQIKAKRFTAMSKLIGIVIGVLSLVTIGYSMIVMVVLQDLSSLPALLGGILGLAATYVGFYISMAKAEHIEDKKNDIKKEIINLRKTGESLSPEQQEKAEELEEILNSVYNELQEVEDESTDINIGI